MKIEKRKKLRDSINEIVKELNLAEYDFKLVRLTRYEQILGSIVEKFTSLKRTKINKWWWDFFNEPIYFINPKNALETLESLIDKHETVWFVAEDEQKEKEHFWLYEGKINAIVSVLEECNFLEYYIVSKKLEWILCENHHGILIGCGEKIIRKLKLEETKQLQEV